MRSSRWWRSQRSPERTSGTSTGSAAAGAKALARCTCEDGGDIPTNAVSDKSPMTPNNVPRTERPTDMTASPVISTPFRVRGGTRDALHHTAGSAPAPYALLRTPGSRGGVIGRNHRLTDWIDLVGDLLQRPLTELPV